MEAEVLDVDVPPRRRVTGAVAGGGRHRSGAADGGTGAELATYKVLLVARRAGRGAAATCAGIGAAAGQTWLRAARLSDVAPLGVAIKRVVPLGAAHRAARAGGDVERAALRALLATLPRGAAATSQVPVTAAPPSSRAGSAPSPTAPSAAACGAPGRGRVRAVRRRRARGRAAQPRRPPSSTLGSGARRSPSSRPRRMLAIGAAALEAACRRPASASAPRTMLCDAASREPLARRDVAAGGGARVVVRDSTGQVHAAEPCGGAGAGTDGRAEAEAEAEAQGAPATFALRWSVWRRAW